MCSLVASQEILHGPALQTFLLIKHLVKVGAVVYDCNMTVVEVHDSVAGGCCDSARDMLGLRKTLLTFAKYYHVGCSVLLFSEGGGVLQLHYLCFRRRR